jgi:hypothetical protein
MMREYQVRICERLGVQFPGPTRQGRRFGTTRACFNTASVSRPLPGDLTRLLSAKSRYSDHGRRTAKFDPKRSFGAIGHDGESCARSGHSREARKSPRPSRAVFRARCNLKVIKASQDRNSALKLLHNSFEGKAMDLSASCRSRKLLASVAAVALTMSMLSYADVAAAQVAMPPYKLSVFATGANGNSQPDSMVQWRDSIIVAFQNGVAKDGTDGKSSTIVQYSLSGVVRRSFSVVGHNDGLRVVGENELWCLQNEDANSNLVVINLASGRQVRLTFPSPPHGGGYDDLVVLNDQVFITASNPKLDANGVNEFPALLRITLQNGQIHLDTVLKGTRRRPTFRPATPSPST